MKYSSNDTIARMIESNTSEFFMELGRLSRDELYDSSEIKYIFSKNFESRIFMANFDGADSFNIMDKIISRTKELNISALWYVSTLSQPSNLKNSFK
jgi:hypothetical protein